MFLCVIRHGRSRFYEVNDTEVVWTSGEWHERPRQSKAWRTRSGEAAAVARGREHAEQMAQRLLWDGLAL